MSTKLENPFAMKSISKMYLKSNLADVHFTFPNDDEKVPAHKAILASASPVFEAMFYGPLKKANIVKVTDSSADAFKEFLQLVYLPEITLTMQNYQEVIRLADKCDMLNYFETFVPFIERHLTIDNLLMSHQLAIKFKISELRKYCEGLIRFFTIDVLKSESFLQCKRNVIEHILQQNVLECSEGDLFEACIAWAKSACQRNRLDANNLENLKNQLGNCFHLIRFGAMDDGDLSSILSNRVYNSLFTQEEWTDLMQRKFDPKFQSKTFKSVPRSKALNDSKKLICEPKRIYTPGSEYYIEDQKSTYFSTNEPILLTNITFYEIRSNHNGSNYDRLTGNFEIIEYNSNTTATNAPLKVLRKSQKFCSIPNSMNDNFDVAISPIIINPKKIYEIRLIFMQNRIQYRTYNEYSIEYPFTDVKVNDKVTITFHQNPFDNEKKDCPCMVSKLTLYQLK